MIFLRTNGVREKERFSVPPCCVSECCPTKERVKSPTTGSPSMLLHILKWRPLYESLNGF